MKLSSIIQSDLPFVVYKKPYSSKLIVIQQDDTKLHTDNSLKQEGFYFVPFDFDLHPVVVFPAELSTESDYLIRNLELEEKSYSFNLMMNESEQEIHQNKVVKAISLIQAKKIEKVIISRKIEVVTHNFEMYISVLKLMYQRDESFVYLWHHPQIGTWMGVTPELLADYQENTLKTVALAGTLSVQPDLPVNWQIKEINEQKIVSDYIVSQLQAFSDKMEVGKPKTVYQGSIAHIKNEIFAEISLKNITKAIKQLHPTPAVCGTPTKVAKKVIKNIEEYDRKYYTGFLGMKRSNKLYFYVNLRCMEIINKKIFLYVGGGIVIDSIPKKEWQETEFKSRILLDNI